MKPTYLLRVEAYGYSILAVYPDGDYEFVEKFRTKRAAEKELRRLRKEG